MTHTTLTSKGQVTIPAEIRQVLGLQAGDRLILKLTSNGFTATIERPPKPADLRGLFRHAARPGTTRAEERAAYESALAGQDEP